MSRHEKILFVMSAGLDFPVLCPPYGVGLPCYLGQLMIDDIGAVESIADYEIRKCYTSDV